MAIEFLSTIENYYYVRLLKNYKICRLLMIETFSYINLKNNVIFNAIMMSYHHNNIFDKTSPTVKDNYNYTLYIIKIYNNYSYSLTYFPRFQMS